ncbi:MAG: CPBP family intramembrane glutamic endopeptidase [Candidatus Promineifilaceae bacterium]|nr:CPBP family intramembrane glutamic endopeptidase [Candidatus Promineifilaceae bacterium]
MSTKHSELAAHPASHKIFADIHWRPGRDTLVAFISYIFVVAALYLAFQIFTTEHIAANFITFGPITLAGLGVAVPLFYTVLARRRPLADVGLTTYQLLPSLTLSLFLGWDTYRNTIGTLNVTWTDTLVPLVTMVLAVGLFEAIFFRGWLQLRFEAAFGMVPGLLLGALCYSLYHIGYGMEADELLFLLGLGLVFGAFFRLTKSIFVLWPFYTPIGGLYTNLGEGLALPFEATYGFLLTMGLMAAIIAVASALYRRKRH